MEPSLSAMLPITTVTEEEKHDFKWNVNQTKQLLELYYTNKKYVGTFKIKTQKKLWEIISEKLKSESGIAVTSTNCMNRWRVVERQYKK